MKAENSKGDSTDSAQDSSRGSGHNRPISIITVNAIQRCTDGRAGADEAQASAQLWMVGFSRNTALRDQGGPVTELGCRDVLDFAIQHPRQAQQHFGGAGRALPGAVPDGIAILAEIRGTQRYVLKHRRGHTFT